MYCLPHSLEYRPPKEEYRIPAIDFSSAIPFIPVRRVPQHQLGYGVLGRYFPGSGQVDIVDWAHGNDFEEVYAHEARHAMNPDSGEEDVRQFTRNVMGESRWN